jgi:preprotein translocase subunit SecF
MSRLGNLGHRLHRGEVSYDFVGKRKLWYGVSVLITVAAVVGLVVNGLKLGIEFSGGAVYTTPRTSMSVSEAQNKIEGDTGGHEAVVQRLGTGSITVTVSEVSSQQAQEIQEKLAKDLGYTAEQVNEDIIGPSWGSEVSSKAVQGLVIFMVLVTIYLAIAFEWRMALAALIALIHDLTITIGVYAIVGFEVTPGTVIGLLTVLGYSLYDTVVVFDGLKESTKGVTKQTRFTYSELANRSLNQTLVRSINTTVVALLPVAGLLFVGGGLLGAGTLNDIALSLFIGLAAGAYSSIFIATPLVAGLKERDPAMKALKKRVLAKRASEAAKVRAAEAGEGEDDAAAAEPDDAHPAAAGVTGPRRQPTSRNRGGHSRSSGKRR